MTYYTKKGKKRAKKGKKQRGNEKKRREKKTKPKSSCMRSGHRPSPEGTRLLIAGTISPMIYPGDGPTEGRHSKTTRKARKRKEKKRRGTETQKELPNHRIPFVLP